MFFNRFSILTFGFGVGCCFCPKNCSEGPGVCGGGGVGGVVLVGVFVFGFGFVVFRVCLKCVFVFGDLPFDSDQV